MTPIKILWIAAVKNCMKVTVKTANTMSHGGTPCSAKIAGAEGNCKISCPEKVTLKCPSCLQDVLCASCATCIINAPCEQLAPIFSIDQRSLYPHQIFGSRLESMFEQGEVLEIENEEPSTYQHAENIDDSDLDTIPHLIHVSGDDTDDSIQVLYTDDDDSDTEMTDEDQIMIFTRPIHLTPRVRFPTRTFRTEGSPILDYHSPDTFVGPFVPSPPESLCMDNTGFFRSIASMAKICKKSDDHKNEMIQEILKQKVQPMRDNLKQHLHGTAFKAGAFGLLGIDYLRTELTPAGLADRLCSAVGSVDLSPIQDALDAVLEKTSEDAVDFAMSVISLMYRLVKLETPTDLFFAAFDFIRSVFPRDMIKDKIAEVKEFIISALEKFSKNINSNVPDQSQDALNLHMKTESKLTDSLRTIQNGLDTVMSSELVTTVRDFVLSLVAFKAFSSTTAKSITKHLGPAKATSFVGMMGITLAMSIAVLTFYDRFDRNRTFHEILASEDPIVDFISAANTLELRYDLTYTGMPVEGKYDIRQYSSAVGKLVTVGEEIISSLPRLSSQRIAVIRVHRKMMLIKNELRNKMTGRTRAAPFCIVIEGQPGVGKSLILPYLCKLWSKIKGRQYDDSHVYHRVAGEDYWSGYREDEQPIIHLSEPGSLHRAIAAARGDPTMTEFLSLIDNLPMCVPMADIKDKGKHFAIPELVIIDCNDPKMNMDLVVNNSAALRRRMVFVRPVVKEEFAMTGSTMIDVDKSRNSDIPLMDRWNFQVYTQVPITNDKSHTVNQLQGDIYAISEFFKNAFTKHIVDQEYRIALGDSIDVDDYLVNGTVFYGPDNEAEHYIKNYTTIELSPEEITVEAEERSKFNSNFKTQARLISDIEIDTAQHVLNSTPSFAISDRKMAEELLYSFWLVFSALLVYLFYTVGFFFCLFWPQNFVFKIFTVRTARAKMLHSKVVYQFYKNHFWRSLGFNVKLVHRTKKPGTFNVAKYVMVLTAIYGFFKVYRTFSMMLAPPSEFVTAKIKRSTYEEAQLRAVTLRAESNVVHASTEREEWDVDIKFTEELEKSNPQRSPPLAKPKGAIDWNNIPYQSKPRMVQDSVQTNEHYKVSNAVANNQRYVESEGKNSFETMILGVRGDMALINRHSLGHPKTDGTWSLRVQLRKGHPVSRVKCIIRSTELCQVDTDIYCVRIRGAQFTDISKYFINHHLDLPIYGAYGYIEGNQVTVKNSPPIVCSDEHWGEVTVSKPLEYTWNEHADGKCGTALLIEYSGALGIAGLHIGGSTSCLKAISQSIVYTDVMTAIFKTSQTSVGVEVFSQGALRLPANCSGLGKISARSPLLFEETGSMLVHGGMKGHKFSKTGKSKLIKTQFINVAEELTGAKPYRDDGNPVVGPPPFGPITTPSGEYASAFNNFIKKAGVEKESLDPKILGVVIDLIVNHVDSGLTEANVTHLAPLPIEIAVNGDPEEYTQRAVNQTTSGGFLWAGSKKKNSVEVDLDFKDIGFMPVWQVKEQMYETILSYTNKQNAMPLLGAQLKDEPRSWEKIQQAKTRVFAMSSYDAVVLQKIYLAPFYTQMVAHGDIFCTSIGINMHSTNVRDFVIGIDTFSKHLMEGDYSGYDTSMPFDIGLAANTIIYKVLERKGYNAEALNIVKGLLSDNLTPTIVMNGDIFSVPALQASGKLGTAEDNSLRGLIMLVYAFIVKCTAEGVNHPLNTTVKYKPNQFFELIYPKIYGDDLLAAVKDELTPHYSNVTYQRFCREVYGLDFTNALKTLMMEPFLKLNQASFLKRTFVFREDLQQWVAPLDLVSCMKTISWTIPSKSVSAMDQQIDSCTSVLRELFFHLKEDEFEERRRRFAYYCAQFFLIEECDVLKHFPRFDAIKHSLYGEPIVELAT